MDTTLIFALVGAVTGITGVLLSATNMIRDRARLVMQIRQTGFDDNDGGFQHCLIVYLGNAGRQPIALLDAGIQWQRRLHLFHRLLAFLGRLLYKTARVKSLGVRMERIMLPRLVNSAMPEQAQPLMLQPGELVKFTLLRGESTQAWRVGRECRAYADDYLGRTHRSSQQVSVDAKHYQYLRADET